MAEEPNEGIVERREGEERAVEVEMRFRLLDHLGRALIGEKRRTARERQSIALCRVGQRGRVDDPLRNVHRFLVEISSSNLAL